MGVAAWVGVGDGVDVGGLFACGAQANNATAATAMICAHEFARGVNDIQDTLDFSAGLNISAEDTDDTDKSFKKSAPFVSSAEILKSPGL